MRKLGIARLTGSICLFFISAVLVSAHELNPEFIERVTGETITSDHHSDRSESEADPRDENRTYYSFPEWYIVYSAQEYADFVAAGEFPSQYPYFASIGQMWDSWEYSEAAAASAPDATTNTVLWTIAISYTVESAIIGFYEKTLGRLSEWSFLRYKTAEDTYIDEQAMAYGTFLNQTPWFYFPYGSSLSGLWQTYGWSSITPRGLERRISYTVGYTVKALYAGVIRFLSESTYEGGAGQVTHAEVRASSDIMASVMSSSSPVANEGNRYHVDFPRYRAFRDRAIDFANNGGEFITIAGNDEIAFSVVASVPFPCETLLSQVLYDMPLVTNAAQARYMLQVRVPNLANALRQADACNVSVEHIYDY